MFSKLCAKRFVSLGPRYVDRCKPFGVHRKWAVAASSIASTRQLQLDEKYKTLICDFSYIIKENFVELRTNNGDELRLSFDWLRDCCQCLHCRHPESGLRIAPLPNVIRDGLSVCKVEHKGGAMDDFTLLFTWSDGHVTMANMSWLRNHGQGQALLPMKILWNADRVPALDYARVDYDDIMSRDDVVRHFLNSILRYGLALVNQVPATDRNTRLVMERIGPIWPTFWGEIYHVVADLTIHSHPSYTGGDLALHNDTNYYYEGAGIQAFHVLEHTGSGGTNKLVDGFHVAMKIKSEHPEIYDYLSTKTFSFKYIADGKLHLVNEDTLLKHHPVSNQLEQIRFTPYDFDTFRTVPQEDVSLHYRALSLLKSELNSLANGHWLQLTPGKLLVTDNWRVLHGRSNFTGRRTLCGMYVSHSDFLSRCRKLGLL